jgi:hypothetical protein
VKFWASSISCSRVFLFVWQSVFGCFIRFVFVDRIGSLWTGVWCSSAEERFDRFYLLPIRRCGGIFEQYLDILSGVLCYLHHFGLVFLVSTRPDLVQCYFLYFYFEVFQCP